MTLALVAVLVSIFTGGDDDEAAPVTSTTSTTSTTSSSTTSSTTTTTTTTTAPTTTTTASTTTTTTTAPPTTTTASSVPPPASPVVLEPTGLSGLAFGEGSQPVVDELTRVLGPPDEDTGEVDALSSPFGVCPGTTVRGVRWGTLTALFTDGETSYAPAGPPHFFAWTESSFSATGDEPPLGLRTAAGIGLGSTVADLRAAYGDDVEVAVDELTGAPAFRIESTAVVDLFGSVTDVSDSGEVEVIEVPGCGE